MKYMLCCFLVVFGFVAVLISAEEKRPSVLFCSPNGAIQGNVDLTWLRELRDAGIDADYTDSHADFSWNRVRQYNCLVVFGCPAADYRKVYGFPDQGPRLKEYVEVIERFLAAGGGVFMMVHTDNADEHVKPLIEPWGARLPFETYVETDGAKVAPVPRMPGQVPLALTDQVRPSPISGGVKSLWFPYGDRYSTSWTAPISVSKEWQVVVKGSKTSRTQPVDATKNPYSIPAPPQALVRPEGVAEPDLVAIREYGKGRIVLLCQAPVFSIGQGTQWLFDRHCLSKGLNETPSDFERLVHNAFRWLAEPSLKTGKLGGYRADPRRLDPPNLQSGVKEKFEKKFWSEEELESQGPPRNGRVYRGLIGAQTAFSVGKGTVLEYAAAAKQAGLDFVAFMERFPEMTPEKFKQLEDECRKHSDDKLLLLPGYTIDTNIGNHMFFTGYGLPWPSKTPKNLLTGPGKTLLMLQFQDEQGKFVQGPNSYLQWVLYQHDRFGGQMVGFYDFDNPRAMQPTDLKLCSAVAVKTYRDGKLVDNQTEGYLLSTAGTLSCLPVAVSVVRSPEELVAEAASGHALTYAKGRSLATLPKDALRWNSQYDGMNVSASEGPVIQAWPQCYRVHTYGAEPFVADRELMLSELHVTSDVGLQEIRIVNADRLVRRFLPGGAKEFRQVLHLPGHVQQYPVAIARDVQGREAVSFVRRSVKCGSMGIEFCGDHVNDAGRMYLARSTGGFQTHRFPLLPAGFTWDGGPKGVLPSVSLDSNLPRVVSSLGEEGGKALNNIPILEFNDDQAIVARSVVKEVYDPAVPALNAWYNYGPKDPSKLIESVRRYMEFNRPLLGPAPTGWAAFSERSGAVLANFVNVVRFKKEQKVQELELLRTNWFQMVPLFLVAGAGTGHRSYYLGDGSSGFDLPVAGGEWFGFYTSGIHNPVLFINRGDPLVVRVNSNPGGSTFISVRADIAGRTVRAGDTFRCELFSVNEPLDVTERGPSRFKRVLSYLKQPEGLEIVRGKRQSTSGFVQMETAANQPVELKVPRPAKPIGLTVPVRVSGLNPRWSAGLFQVKGHSTGFYTKGENVYTALGFDFDGQVYAALFPDQVPLTHVVIGHPIICDKPDLFLEVMPRTDGKGGYQWHVAVNNPTDKTITTTLRQNMDLPGLAFAEREITVPPGKYIKIME